MTGRTYTDPGVLTCGVAEGWADAETDPARIDWPARQATALIPFRVVDGRPVNPCERTSVQCGRNGFGLWGENRTADALVTVTHQCLRYLLMIKRADGHGWAVPGGMADAGETGTETAIRELAEEAGLAVAASACREMPARYVPDPRASDEAWAVTVPVHMNLGEQDVLPFVAGGDDARRAEWVRVRDFGTLKATLSQIYGGRVFAAHAGMLQQFLDGAP